MREAQFLRRNRDRWASYEQRPASHPDEQADRFIRLTDDLAYARTFYPGSKTVDYLNGLTTRLHLDIYRNRREKGSRFARFFSRDLPSVMARHRRQLLYAFLLFTCFMAIGTVSAHYDEDFVRLILGDQYVDMTRRNIEEGDPFRVYKDMDPLPMFLRIALNNILVSLRVFVLGLLGGVGTVYGLFHNGLMLGAFEHMFFSIGLGGASVLVVFIHGTLEISAIIIAGAAGLVLGKSILFPGTHARLASLMQGARDGLSILLGLMPVLLVAAFFEGYVTRHTGMPLWTSLSILGGSLAFILWYFILLPIRVSRPGTGTQPPASALSQPGNKAT
jgi:uncharacterized membrane protein SpoIIM required for sporulation